MRSVVLLLFLASAVSAQSFRRNDITFSGGTSWDVSNYSQYVTVVSLGATYGYRITRTIELEAGAFGAINPVPGGCESSGCFSPEGRAIWVPFGVRFILPLKHDRFELSAGVGGLYQNISGGGYSYNAFGGYAKISAAVALDHGRHFWLGATPRIMLANGQYARDRWFMLTGDIGFRF